MNLGSFYTLASLQAVRPVFLIVMGVFLVLVGWRLARNASPWTARILAAGALLLGAGYAVILPLYQAGLVEPFRPNGHYHGSAATAVGWHVVKVVAMNFGWLLFGLGVAMHANLFNSSSPRSRAENPSLSPHESVA